jgi:DivIVA domain-containing protein
MAPDVTPEEIRKAQFRTTLRGLDRGEVESVLALAAGKIEELETRCGQLEAKLAEAPAQDMASEFEHVGHEVTSILQAAREAAESIRERAGSDAAIWRREAVEEADTARKEAAADAEAMRRDAWVTGSDLLEQTAATAEAMRAAAERDVLTVMGEAERDAHRLTSGARREAEDMVRNANMEAEKITSDATKRRDEIIDGANRQAATAQERARALEQRRDELLVELENVRATLTRLEGSLEERREALDLTRIAPEDTSVRIVHPPADAKQDWELGETVRVVPKEPREPFEPDLGIADELSDQVARIQDPPEREHAPGREETETPSSPESAPALEPTAPEPPVEASPRAAADPAMEDQEADPGNGSAQEAPTSPTGESADDVGALFASLRGGGEGTPEPASDEDSADQKADGSTEEPQPDEIAQADEPVKPAGAGVTDGTDWIAVRDSRLLPITNRALRGVKKAMTEVQNVALDSLRTEEDWNPDERAIAESIHAELVAVWSESYAAGHAAAEQMAGDRLKRPATPASAADRDFASDLANAVRTALEKAGEGPRDRQSAASRVFRVWRSDEAERRIRDIAILGYETGIEKSQTVAAR